MATPDLSLYYGREVVGANANSDDDTPKIEIILDGNVSICGNYEYPNDAPDLQLKFARQYIGSVLTFCTFTEGATTLSFSGQSNIVFSPTEYTIMDESLSDRRVSPQDTEGEFAPDLPVVVPEPPAARILEGPEDTSAYVPPE